MAPESTVLFVEELKPLCGERLPCVDKLAGTDNGSALFDCLDARENALRRILAAEGIYIFAVALTISSRPALMLSATGNDTSRAAMFAGSVDAAQALACALTAPILGALSDVHGRVPILQLCAAVEAVALIGVALARRSLPGQFVSYMLIAISGASTVTFAAAIADLCPNPADATRAYAMFGAVLGGTFMVGPLVGGLIAGWFSPAAALIVSAAILAIAAPLFGYFLHETRIPSLSAIESPPSVFLSLQSSLESPLPKIRRSLTANRALTLFVAANVLSSLAESGLVSIMFMYVNERVGWGAPEVGAFLSATGLLLLLSQVLFAPRLVRLFGERTVIVAGYVFGGIHFIVYGLARKPWMFWTGLILALPSFVSYPPQKAVLARQVEPHQQGELQGSLSALNSLVKPVSTLGCATMFTIGVSSGAPGVVFMVIAAVTFCAAGIAHLALSHPELK